MEILKRTNEYLHAPDEQAVSCCEVKVGMKRKARDSQDSSHHIVGEGLETVTEGTAAKLPKLDSLKRTIQRQRVRQQAAPVQPATLEQLTLPEEYKRTSKGEQLLLYDSVLVSQRILIFGTQRNLEMLQLSSVWLATSSNRAGTSCGAANARAGICRMRIASSWSWEYSACIPTACTLRNRFCVR